MMSALALAKGCWVLVLRRSWLIILHTWHIFNMPALAFGKSTIPQANKPTLAAAAACIVKTLLLISRGAALSTDTHKRPLCLTSSDNPIIMPFTRMSHKFELRMQDAAEKANVLSTTAAY